MVPSQRPHFILFTLFLIAVLLISFQPTLERIAGDLGRVTPPPPGRTLGIQQTCGNNIIEGLEECDGTSDQACPGNCIPPGTTGECTCAGGGSVCGDAFCDLSELLACPSDCQVTHYWPMNEGSGNTVQDVIGGHSGSLTGTAQWSQDCHSGSCITLDGDDSTGTHIDLGTLDLGGSQLTIAGWQKIDDFTPPASCSTGMDCRTLISKATTWNEQDHYFMIGTTDNNGPAPRFRLKTGGSTVTHIGTGNSLIQGQWQHVAVTYDGSLVKLYVDGSEIYSAPQAGTVDTNPSVQT